MNISLKTATQLAGLAAILALPAVLLLTTKATWFSCWTISGFLLSIKTSAGLLALYIPVLILVWSVVFPDNLQTSTTRFVRNRLASASVYTIVPILIVLNLSVLALPLLVQPAFCGARLQNYVDNHNWNEVRAEIGRLKLLPLNEDVLRSLEIYADSSIAVSQGSEVPLRQIYQAIQALLERGLNPRGLCALSLGSVARKMYFEENDMRIIHSAIQTLQRFATSESDPEIKGRYMARMGELYLVTEDLAQARTYFENATSLLSRGAVLATVNVNIGTIYALNENYEVSIIYYEKAEGDFPDGLVHVFHSNYGVALAKSGNIGAAEDHLIRSISISEDYLPAYINLGLLYEGQERYEDARHQFQKIVDNPQADRFKLREARVFMGMIIEKEGGRFGDALVYYLAALDRPESDASGEMDEQEKGLLYAGLARLLKDTNGLGYADAINWFEERARAQLE